MWPVEAKQRRHKTAAHPPAVVDARLHRRSREDVGQAGGEETGARIRGCEARRRPLPELKAELESSAAAMVDLRSGPGATPA
jgi:hypothetical protein